MFNFFKPKGYTVLKAWDFKFTLKSSRRSFILDVRSQHEFKEEKIPNAYNLSIMDPRFKNKINNFDKSRSYFVYCQNGMRARKSCRILVKNDFKKVFCLKGGLNAWEGRTV